MNKRFIASIVLVFLLSMLVGCAGRSRPSQSEPGLDHQAFLQMRDLPGEEYLRTELFFGTSIAATAEHPADAVSEAQWKDFVEQWITPRFPYGLTVIDGSGQWLGQDGDIARERAKVLVLLVSVSSPEEQAAAERSIEEIRATYCRLFHQESVLRVTSSVKVDF